MIIKQHPQPQGKYPIGITIAANPDTMLDTDPFDAFGVLTSSDRVTSIELEYAATTYYPAVQENWTQALAADAPNVLVTVRAYYDDGREAYAEVTITIGET